MKTSSDGEFWTPERPDVRLRGTFSTEPGESVQVSLTAFLPRAEPVSWPAFERGDVAGATRAHAAISVAKFQPVTVWGELDSGECVSIIDANDHGDSERSDLVGNIGVFGGLVPRDQLYSSVRFRLDHPYRLRHLCGGESFVVPDDQSTLGVEESEDGNWLVYESSAPAALRQLDIRVVAGCLALAQLALFPEPESNLVTREMQLRMTSDSAWLPVIGPAFCADPHQPRMDTLLPHKELTVERFAKWIALNDTFDGLAWAVARRMDVAVQLQVQLLTSLVEGFHRRLTPPREQTRFPDATKAALKRVREAATQAAVDQAQREGLDPQIVGRSVTSALGHFSDKSFLERAEEIVDRVCSAVPEIAVSIPNLASKITDPRHSFAHQLPQDDVKDPFETRFDRWAVVSRVTPWLLRALILLEIGIDPATLRENCLNKQYFAMFRENAERRVRDLGWDNPPSRKPRQRVYTPSVVGDR